MKVKSLRHWLRVGHYWLGVIVSMQLLIWLGTGIYFNITPYEALKGKLYFKTPPQLEKQSFSVNELLPLASILARVKPVEQVSLISLNQRPVYLLDEQVQRYQHDCKQQTLIDALSGEEVMIDSHLAEQLAKQTYTGNGEVIQTQKLSAPFDEWPKECNPLWQVSINDDLNTRIYINGVNGRLVGHKNDRTDLADLMFKLHFMDYLHQGSFNNPFSWFFGLVMLILSLTGLYWVIENLLMKRYRVRVKSG
ncbi:peptidase [Shewanella sp. UCD-FRSSP16_17]|uniref:PepSY domain-containing protein n=1 Tax=Shewanella sp. UCD-FRSSP16_17 TaxID=1853256 RepID=UPI0007EED3FC|nr:PepSY domain-containing protein [Shewanella sp. UCD-FRSSP16_17]OBT08041.1 peptidase [Shewanella sp. UCD-FRSSP16_17]